VSISGQMFGAVMGLEAADSDEAAAYQAALVEHGTTAASRTTDHKEHA
jgi:hypothetical protein